MTLQIKDSAGKVHEADALMNGVVWVKDSDKYFTIGINAEWHIPELEEARKEIKRLKKRLQSAYDDGYQAAINDYDYNTGYDLIPPIMSKKRDKKLWNEAVKKTLLEVKQYDGIITDEIDRLYIVEQVFKKVAYKLTPAQRVK